MIMRKQGKREQVQDLDNLEESNIHECKKREILFDNCEVNECTINPKHCPHQ